MRPISVRLDDMDDLSPARQRDRACFRHYLQDAVKGDPEARLMLRSFYHLTGWYSKPHGDVIGTLSEVVRERAKQ